jgi:hypothetical protein
MKENHNHSSHNEFVNEEKSLSFTAILSCPVNPAIMNSTYAVAETLAFREHGIIQYICQFVLLCTM